MPAMFLGVSGKPVVPVFVVLIDWSFMKVRRVSIVFTVVSLAPSMLSDTF